jgi:hypothetical protein
VDLETDRRHVDHGCMGERFERWLRTTFMELNTELEEAYFAERAELLSRPDLDVRKRAIAADGCRLVRDIPILAGELERYQLLGAVGFLLAACRRHEVDLPEPGPVWALATALGTGLGVAPRYVFAHQVLYGYRTFTALPDERVFVTCNGLGVLAYERAAHALRRIPAIGVTSPLTAALLDQAAAALGDVLHANRALAESLDVDRFFLNIRPYFKPHLVGGVEFRGANAGDFAAINEIDLLLGLCSPLDPFYQRVLAEKQPYLPPEDQARLRDATPRRSLLDLFLAEAGSVPAAHVERFLAVCRAHAAAYSFHHHRLVKPFLEQPAARDTVTASGPPLEAVLSGLQRLLDLRAARERPGLETARARLDRLRGMIAAPVPA